MGVLQFIIIITFLISLISFVYGYLPHLKSFSFFLMITFGVELLGRYIKSQDGNNHLLYSIYTFFIFIYFSFFYYRVIENILIKRTIIFFVSLYPIFFLINVLWIQGTTKFHTYTYVLGSVYLIFLCLSYFKKLIESDKLDFILTKPEFWISLALLLFYSVDILFTASINTIASKNNNLALSFVKVITYMNYAMYIIFAFGFLLSIKNTKWKK